VGRVEGALAVAGGEEGVRVEEEQGSAAQQGMAGAFSIQARVVAVEARHRRACRGTGAAEPFPGHVCSTQGGRGGSGEHARARARA